MKFKYLICLSFILNCYFVQSCQNLSSPNIILFLTDDQDQLLFGMDPMIKTKTWFQTGQSFDNAFVSTPICCPSRSSLLTGRYQHNTHVVNNSISGNCYGKKWYGLESRSTFASILKDNTDYDTFYAGKYLNQYHGKAVPRGWNYWAGLIGNSRYYNYKLNINGHLEHHGFNYTEDYLTDVIGRLALNFLRNQTCQRPFLMVLAFPAPHAPFTPAPQYADHFSELVAPRIPSFNHVEDPSEAKHWLVRRQPRPLNSTFVNQIDEVFRNRWRTLLSVDDVVDSVMTYLDSENMLENTVAIYTSDHGYHLGTYGLPLDKRMPYDTDIRVPLLIRGPDITNDLNQPANVVITTDLAPTILDIAGK